MLNGDSRLRVAGVLKRTTTWAKRIGQPSASFPRFLIPNSSSALPYDFFRGGERSNHPSPRHITCISYCDGLALQLEIPFLLNDGGDCSGLSAPVQPTSSVGRRDERAIGLASNCSWNKPHVQSQFLRSFRSTGATRQATA